MKKILVVLLSVFVVIMSYLAFKGLNTSYALDNSFDSKKNALYMWNIDEVDYSSFDKLVDYLRLDTLYVGSYGDFSSYKHTLLFNFAKDHNLTSYIVYGEKEASLKDVKKLMDQVVEYNNTHEYKITGLAIDSEFHTTDEYRKADAEGRKVIFRKYVDFMEEAYAYAKQNNLKYVSCIPVNYDSISEELLEELIRDGSDYIQIMNYNKNGKITKIEKEVELAKKYDKKVESIAELLPPGHHDVTDSITFWNQGLDACTDSFREIEAHYNYEKMTYAYHYYNPVVELAKDVLNLTSDYNYELYPKDEEGNTKEVNNVYLVNDEEKIKGFTFYNKKSKEYIVYFYGVDYSKVYNLVVENASYDINNTVVVYPMSEDRIKYDERVFVEKAEEPEENDPFKEEQEDNNEENPESNEENQEGNNNEENTDNNEKNPNQEEGEDTPSQNENDSEDNNENENTNEEQTSEDNMQEEEQPNQNDDSNTNQDNEEDNSNVEKEPQTPVEDNHINEEYKEEVSKPEIPKEDVSEKEEIVEEEIVSIPEDVIENPPYTGLVYESESEAVELSVNLIILLLLGVVLKNLVIKFDRN